MLLAIGWKRTWLVPAIFVLSLTIAGGPVGLSGRAELLAADYLSPEESLARMEVPEGVEVYAFATEPDIVNPIAFCIDERGRLYVVESWEYPLGAQPGQTPRDKIYIFEDTDGDRRFDRRTLFADELDLVSGIEVGYGGVFVGAAPYLLFLEDTDGDDRADRREVLLEGWGRHDTHETLNSFIWGPDGWLYGCHGVFTHSNINGVQFSAAVWRYHPRTRDFEVFAEGTSNPWGFDFNEVGSSFLTACVIPHLYHMVPGGLYIRQAGQNANPYAYGQYPEISDHFHYYGVRPHAGNNDPRSGATGGGHAHCGALCYLGDSLPERYRGSILMGNIHGNRVNNDYLVPNGSSYIGTHGRDFLLANDPAFRCIALETGPDGSIYLIDWHESFPCHNTDPHVWDRTHGRVYNIVYEGTEPQVGIHLGQCSSEELIELLRHPNSWHNRTANRILAERRDPATIEPLRAMVLESEDPIHALRALWALYSVGGFDEEFARQTLRHEDEWVRAWAVRFLGEADRVSGAMLDRLVGLAASDPSPHVRLQLASTCQRLRAHNNVLPILGELALHAADAEDPMIPFMIWLGAEPYVPQQTDGILGYLTDHAPGNALITDHLVGRTMRRLIDSGQAEHLAAAVRFAAEVEDGAVRQAALDGLVTGLAGRRLQPPAGWAEAFARLRDDPSRQVQLAARRLAAHFGDAEATRLAEADAVDESLAADERIEALRVIALGRQPSSVEPLLGLLRTELPIEVRRELLQALAAFDDPRIAEQLLAAWEELGPELRVEVLNLLSGRLHWAGELLTAVAEGRIEQTELNANVLLRMRGLNDEALNERITELYGQVRTESPEELARLIEQMNNVMYQDRADLERGAAVFARQCMQCHTFYGRGSTVGPDLTGANREMAYLLINVLDPNRVVGQGYLTNVIATIDGQVLTGIVIEETEQTVTLKRENDVVTVIPVDEIDERVVQDISIMPQGLGDNMTPEEFRDLIGFLMANPFLTEVRVAGPFVASDPYEEAFPPEANPGDPTGVDGVEWESPRIGPPGRIDLTGLGVQHPRGDSAAYIYAEVEAPEPVETDLLLGTDDALVIWLNGAQIYANPEGNARLPEPDQEVVHVRLQEGVNRLLLKVVNRGRPIGRGFGDPVFESIVYARLLDPNRMLRDYPELPEAAETAEASASE